MFVDLSYQTQEDGTQSLCIHAIWVDRQNPYTRDGTDICHP
jgi:hypothetical protein